MKIEDRVKEKIAAFVHCPVENLADDAVLSDLVSESFVLVELVIELQEEFQVRLIQEDLKNVKTVRNLVSLIASRASL